MEYLRVKNWDQFQHYKNRNPPWIKLHRSLLSDYEFACLQDASKLLLMMIWLLATHSDGCVPNDPVFLQNKLGLKSIPDVTELIAFGFLTREQHASNVLADCKQLAPHDALLAEQSRGEDIKLAAAREAPVDNSKPAASPPLNDKKPNPQTGDEITAVRLAKIGIGIAGKNLPVVEGWQRDHYGMPDLNAAISVALTHERTRERASWPATFIDKVLRDPANAQALRKHRTAIVGEKCSHCNRPLKNNGSTHLHGGVVCNECHGSYMRNEWAPPTLATTHPPMP